MKTLNPNPQFILLAGDYNGHGLPEKTIETVQNTVFDSIRQAFPNTRILPGIGNNDQDPKNQNSAVEFARLYTLFSQKANITPDQRTTFLSGGYWSYHDLSSGLQVVLLNSNLLYAKSQNLAEWKNVSQQQFVWLEDKLKTARANASKVIIGSHVPPTRTEAENDWEDAAMAQYRALIEKYSDVVLLQIFGHHSTELIRGYSPTFGLSASSGFAPRTAIVPTFQLVQHNYSAPKQTNAVVKEISSYYLDLVSAAANPQASHPWPLLYHMSKTYGVPDVSPQSLFAIASKIVSDQGSANKYFALQMRNPLDVLYIAPADRTRMLCEAASSAPAAVNECVARIDANKSPVSPAPDDMELGYIIGAALLGAALLTIAGGVVFLLIRKKAELDTGRGLLIGD